MINPKELMIGNYLYCEYSDEIIQVTEIKNDGVYASSNKTVIERYYYYEELHPIPIDEKWIIDFGFRDLDYVFVLNAGRKKLLVNWSTRIVSSNIRNNFYLNKYKHIKYIHQLQNLYFALTGKELELKQNTK
jgi:hypothetical protein